MKFLKRAAALALSMALCVTMLAGCSKKPADTSADDKPAVPETIDIASVTDPILTTAGLEGSTVVATAGDIEITASELLYWIAYSADQLLQYYAPQGVQTLPWDAKEDGATLADTMKRNSLENAVLYDLLPTKVKAEGLDLSKEFVESFDQALVKMTEAMGGEEMLSHYLWQFPMDKALYEQMCRSEEYNGVYIDHFFGEGGERCPSDADVLSYLEDEQECYFFKHILFKVDDEDPKSAETQKAKADETLEKLRAAGSDIELFDQLMNELSEDGRTEDGKLYSPNGYLATTNPQSFVGTKMVDAVEKAALGMEEGEISDVVENTQGYHGYHIVLRLPLEGNVSMSDMRPLLVSEEMNKLQTQWIGELDIKTNKNYDAIDPQTFYETLGVLRTAVNDEITALNAPEEDAPAPDASAPADSSAQAPKE